MMQPRHALQSARVAEQVNGPEVKPSHKLSDIIGMLEYRKVVAASVPWLGEVMAKADRDDTILLSKRPGLGIPVSVVVHRIMHQDAAFRFRFPGKPWDIRSRQLI
jgi:hypothetical protein